MSEGAARWSTQLRRGCWVATGLSRWMGCSDPQGPARGRESINPAKMKLCLGCHNPFTSSKLYKLFAVFFAFGWLLIWYSWDPIYRGAAFEFLCSPVCHTASKPKFCSRKNECFNWYMLIMSGIFSLLLSFSLYNAETKSWFYGLNITLL